MWWIAASVAAAAGTCSVEAESAALETALADPACAEIRVGEGWIRGRFSVDRDVRIVGAGTDQSVLGCETGPCLLVVPGANLELAELTLTGQETVLSVWWGELQASDIRLAAQDDRGGFLRLRDSEATLTRARVDVARRHETPINALSSAGNDLVLDEVTFLGVRPASGTESGVYSNAYGVSCSNCRFETERPPLVPPEGWLALDESGGQPADGSTDTTRWATLGCPRPTETDLAACDAQCDGKPVGACTMTWEQTTETCVPDAKCVAPGEELPE